MIFGDRSLSCIEHPERQVERFSRRECEERLWPLAVTQSGLSARAGAYDTKLMPRTIRRQLSGGRLGLRLLQCDLAVL